VRAFVIGSPVVQGVGGAERSRVVHGDVRRAKRLVEDVRHLGVAEIGVRLAHLGAGLLGEVANVLVVLQKLIREASAQGVLHVGEGRRTQFVHLIEVERVLLVGLPRKTKAQCTRTPAQSAYRSA